MQIVVVTAVDARDLAMEDLCWQGPSGVVEPLPAALLLAIRAPVFRVGEILILDADGREFAPPRRKPDKWFVEVTAVADLDEAVRLSRSATAGPGGAR